MKRLTQIMMFGALIALGSIGWAAQQDASADKPMAQQMQKMHGHMQAMQEQMKQIKATKDPEKRQELMHEHMQSMHEGMMMMGKMDHSQGDMMSHGAMQQKKMAVDCKADDAQCQNMQSMQNRQDAMQERMQMMQMMMQQMMEHQSAQADQQ
jgi:hypothetical protein